MNGGALGECDALNETADARANFDRIHRVEVAGELVPVRDRSLDRRRHRHLGSGHLRRVLTASGCREGEGGDGGPAAGMNSEGRRSGARESGTHVARLRNGGQLERLTVALTSDLLYVTDR